MGTRLTITDAHCTPEVLEQTTRTLTQGGCLVIPTFCLYGMAANAFDEAAVRRIFAIKERPLTNPILLLIKDQDAVEPLVQDVPDAAKRLMAHFWPGKLTLVFSASARIPHVITAGTGKVGLRVPSHPVTRAIAKAVPFPLTGTSANIAGEGGIASVDALDSRIIEQSDLIIDAGMLQGGAGSTVVDVTTTPVTILREGTVSAAKIRAILDKSTSF